MDSQMRLAIDPQLCLKNDVDRAVLATRPLPLANRNDFYALLHPVEAIIFALFNGERTIEEVKDLWIDLANKPPQDCERDVNRLLELYGDSNSMNESIFVEVSDENKEEIVRYNPADFVIPHDIVNLQDLRLRKPHLVYYLPTLFCPQKCVYCYAKTSVAPEKNLISLERLREIFQELSALEVEVISLSGGDPLARADIYEILATIIELGMAPDIPTKVGLSFRRMQELRDLGVDIMQVSLDSPDPDIIDHMVGVKNYSTRVFRVLQDLRRCDMSVRVNAVLTPLNVPTVGGLIDYLGNLGNVFKLILTPYGRSMFCHDDRLFIDGEHLEEVRKQIDDRRGLYQHMEVTLAGTAPDVPKDKKARAYEWKNRAFCTANRKGFIILPDGRVTVCEELYDHPDFIIGDLKKQSVMEMWSSPKALSLIHPDQAAIPDGPCKTCNNFVECNSGRGRCWRDVLKAFGWNKAHYPDPRCPLAPAGVRLG